MKKLIFSKLLNRFTKFTENNINKIYNLLKINIYKGKKANYY